MTPTLLRTALGGIAVGLMLSGCSAPTPIAAADAVAHYDQVIADVRTALQPIVTMPDHPRGREVNKTADGCTYTAGFYDPISAPAFVFDDPAWPDVRRHLDTSLKTHGFDTSGEPKQVQASQQLVFTDVHGARLKITSSGDVDVYDIRTDATECTSAEFGLPG